MRTGRQFARWRLGRLALLLILTVTSASAAYQAYAEGAPIEAFFGRYTGHAISSTEEGLSKRDLNVRIKDAGGGKFSVDWMTFTRRSDGRRKRKSYSITFRPTPRQDIFASAMGRDMFGNAVPLDPMKGDPYVWARIKGETLTVYALIITDEGSYELQVYDRTLTEQGLDLRFQRFRDGEKLRLITGTLVKFDQ